MNGMEEPPGLPAERAPEALVLAEHARLEARLAEPAVLRDFVLARRLRRCVHALEPLRESAARVGGLREDLAVARDLAAGDREWAAEAARLAARCRALERALAAALAVRDGYDPYDVVIGVEGGEAARRAVGAYYLALARGRGWRVRPLNGGSGAWRCDAYAVTGDEEAGVWADLKADNGVHHVRAGGEDIGSARVTVHPDGDAVFLPGRDRDWRIGVFCTRDPHGPPMLRIAHPPTGAAYVGTGADQHEAKENALRQAHARAVADAIPAGAPAYRFLHPGPDPVRIHSLPGPTNPL